MKRARGDPSVSSTRRCDCGQIGLHHLCCPTLARVASQIDTNENGWRPPSDRLGPSEAWFADRRRTPFRPVCHAPRGVHSGLSLTPCWPGSSDRLAVRKSFQMSLGYRDQAVRRHDAVRTGIRRSSPSIAACTPPSWTDFLSNSVFALRAIFNRPSPARAGLRCPQRGTPPGRSADPLVDHA